jgi:predicted RNase H-like HicB family nuclease
VKPDNRDTTEGTKGEIMKICESTITIRQEKGRYVLNCPELGIASIGLTLSAAVDNLKMALKHYYDGVKNPGIENAIEKELESWKNLLLC